jgi:hypothetical protein
MIGDEYRDSTPLAAGWNAKTDQVPLLGLCRTVLKIASVGVISRPDSLPFQRRMCGLREINPMDLPGLSSSRTDNLAPTATASGWPVG